MLDDLRGVIWRHISSRTVSGQLPIVDDALARETGDNVTALVLKIGTAAVLLQKEF